MNILILSVGTRDKIVQYFRKAFAGDGRVVAADCSRLAPALYDADKFYIVPKIQCRSPNGCPLVVTIFKTAIFND